MNTARNGILAGGTWIVDHVKLVNGYPEQDTLASILGETRGTGGSPYNVLLNLAKLGAPFPLAGVGLVGEDGDGHAILADCAANGIETTQVRPITEAATSYTDVMTVQSTGRRTFFHYRGANRLLREEHFDLERPQARILHLGYLLLLDGLDAVRSDGTTGTARLLEKARALGFETSVDLVSEDSDRFQTVLLPALPHIDYLVVNEFEASRSTGIPVGEGGRVDFEKAAKAARRLLELGVHKWVVIHCPEGALAVHRSGIVSRQGSVRVPSDQIAGAAGAGDAFAAGMLYGFHENREIGECLKIAVCAAAANLFDPTCTGGMKRLADCLALGHSLGFRML